MADRTISRPSRPSKHTLRDLVDSLGKLIAPQPTEPSSSSSSSTPTAPSKLAEVSPLPDDAASLSERLAAVDLSLSSQQGVSESVGKLDQGIPATAARSAVLVRALEVLCEMQSWLVLETGPVEGREGLTVPDYTLGSIDIRLVKHTLQLTLTHLLDQCLTYTALLRSSDPPTPTATTSPIYGMDRIISLLLVLLQPIAVPPLAPEPDSSSTTSTPSPSPSPTPPVSSAISSSPSPSPSTTTPPTTLAMLTIPHLPSIILSALLLFYTPSLPPPVYAEGRAHFLSTLNALAPRITLSCLSSALSFTRPSKSSSSPSPQSTNNHTTSASSSSTSTTTAQTHTQSQRWTRPWPKYIPTHLTRLLTIQLLRPAGIRGLLENLLSTDEESGPSSLPENTARSEHVVRLLCRVPEGVDGTRYGECIIREAQIVFSPPAPAPSPAAAPGLGQSGPDGSADGPQSTSSAPASAPAQARPSPRSWRRTMGEVVLRLSSIEGKVGEVIRQGLTQPLKENPRTASSSPSPATLAQIHTLALTQGILQHTSSSQVFLKTAVSDNLKEIVQLTVVQQHDGAAPDPSVRDSSGQSRVQVQVPGTAKERVSELARNVLLLWSDLVDPARGAQGVLRVSENTDEVAWKWFEDVDRGLILDALGELTRDTSGGAGLGGDHPISKRLDLHRITRENSGRT